MTRPYNNQKQFKKNQKTCKIVDFAVPADHRLKFQESDMKDKFLDLVKELKKKTVEHESANYTNCNWYFWYSPRRIDTRTGGLGNKWTKEDHPNYSIIKFGQNTEKSPGDLRKLAVIQTSVKDHQLTLM